MIPMQKVLRVNISIHALLAESDFDGGVALPPHQQFLSTLSLRRATKERSKTQKGNYFYPRSPCGERLHVRVQCPYSYRISIHLLAESDEGNNRIWVYFQISIHALLAESDNIPLPNAHIIAISIHALLAESDNGHETSPYRVVISIHALLAESDPSCLSISVLWMISIHALLAESDLRLMFFLAVGGYFYPRSPCGERLQNPIISVNEVPFLSTLSLRRATPYQR